MEVAYSHQGAAKSEIGANYKIRDGNKGLLRVAIGLIAQCMSICLKLFAIPV